MVDDPAVEVRQDEPGQATRPAGAPVPGQVAANDAAVLVGEREAGALRPSLHRLLADPEARQEHDQDHARRQDVDAHPALLTYVSLY
jgi:hypothetical protein